MNQTHWNASHRNFHLNGYKPPRLKKQNNHVMTISSSILDPTPPENQSHNPPTPRFDEQPTPFMNEEP